MFHLNEGQRASVAAKLANMSRGGNGSNQFSKSANLPVSDVSQAEAAAMLNVSERSLRTAKKIQETADDSLLEKVDSGSVSLNSAAYIAELRLSIFLCTKLRRRRGMLN